MTDKTTNQSPLGSKPDIEQAAIECWLQTKNDSVGPPPPAHQPAPMALCRWVEAQLRCAPTGTPKCRPGSSQ